MEITPGLFAAIAIIALLCEYMDASIGMGYGTILSPVLLIIGFSPLEVVPSVLLGQLVGGLASGIAHHRMGNITLDFKRDENVSPRWRWLGYLPRSRDSKVIYLIAICGVIGPLMAVLVAVNISKLVLTTYIGLLVLGIGIFMLVRRGRHGVFSWKGLIGIGLLSSFNKGISGGGYGPLITGGQIISGREVRSSVGSTTLGEVVVCVVGLLGYVLIAKVDVFWTLAAATSIGSLVAAPFAAVTVKKISPENLELAIALITIVLGALTLAKTYIF